MFSKPCAPAQGRVPCTRSRVSGSFGGYYTMTPRSGLNKTALSAALSPKGRNATGWEQAAPREDVPLSAAFSLKGRSACGLRAWPARLAQQMPAGEKIWPGLFEKRKPLLPQTGRGKTVSRLPGSRQFLRRHAVHDGGADAVDEIMQIVDILEQIQPLRLGFHCALQ